MSAGYSEVAEEQCVLEYGRGVGDSKSFKDSAPKFNLLGEVVCSGWESALSVDRDVHCLGADQEILSLLRIAHPDSFLRWGSTF